jgi:hypothetical protein
MTEIRGPGLLRPPRSTYTEDEFFKNFNREMPSRSQAADASYDLSKIDTTVNSIERILEMNRIEAQESELVDPEALNQEYPGLPKPFVKPTKRVVAEEIYRRHKKRADLGTVVSNADNSALTTMATFGAALIPHAIDPVNIIADITVAGTILSVASAGRGVRAAMIAAREQSAGRQFLQGAAEGVAGNLATEPFTFAAAQQEMQDYTAGQALVNITAGGVFFPVARFGLSKTASYVKKLGPNHVEAMAQSSIAQAAAGRRVDLDAHVRDFMAEAGGTPRWAPEYRYAPAANPSNRKFYAGTNHQYPDLRNTVLIDEDLGDGIYLTDSPGVANGISARKLAHKTGKVLEVDLGEARIIDLESHIPTEIRNVLEPIVRDAIGQKKFAELEARPGRELFNEIRESVESGKSNDELVGRVNKALEEAGYDGYRYESGKQGGDASNAVMLFNDSKATVGNRIKPDMSAVRRASDDELKQLVERNQDHKSEWTYDDKAYKEFQEMEDIPVDVETRELQRAADETLEELTEMERIGSLDKTQVKELEELRAAKAQEATNDQMIKSAFACLR